MTQNMWWTTCRLEKRLVIYSQGRKDEVKFEVRAKTKFPFPTYSEIWRRVGQEALLIENHYVETTVFERDAKGLDGANHRWKICYEPDLGIIRQSELPVGDVRGGRGSTQVISVSPF